MALARADVEIRATYDKLGSDMDKALSIVRDGSRKIAAVQEDLARVINTALGGTAVVAVTRLASALDTLTQAGSKATNIASAFEQLGGNLSAINKAKDASLGLANAFDLMALANRATIKGFPDFQNQLASITEFTLKYAKATGQDFPAAMDAMTEALIRGRTRGLAQYFGTLFDSDKALTLWIADHKKAGETFTEYAAKMGIAEKAEANRAYTLRVVHDEAVLLPQPVQDAGTALDAFKVSLSEAYSEIAKGVSENTDYRDAINAARDALIELRDSGALKAIGSQIGELGAMIMQTVTGFEKMAGWVSWLAKNSGASYLAKTAGTIVQSVVGDSYGTKYGSGIMNDALLQQGYVHGGAGLGAQIGMGMLPSQFNSNSGAKPWDPAATVKYLQSVNDLIATQATVGVKAIQQQEQAAKKAADEAKKLTDQWTQYTDQVTRKDLSAALTHDSDVLKEMGQDIGNLDFSQTSASYEKFQQALQTTDFYNDLNKFGEAVGKQVEDHLKGAIGKAINPETGKLVTADDVKAYRDKAIADAKQQYTDQFKKGNEEIAKHFHDQMVQQFQQSVNDWTNIWQQVLSGQKFDFKAMLQDFGAGLLGEITAALTGGTAIKSAASLGQMLGQSFLQSMGLNLPDIFKGGNVFGGGSGGAGGLLSFLGGGNGTSGIGPFANAAQYASALGPQNIGPVADGSQYAQMIGSTGPGIYAAPITAAAAVSAYQTYNSVKGGDVAGSAIWGSLAGGLTTGGLAAIASAIFGGGGPKNPDTISRNNFGDWINKQLGTSPFQTGSGSMISNIDLGSSSDFNKPGWADALSSKYGAEATGTFGAFGEAIKKFLGITQDIGPQIGAILEKNLNGNLSDGVLLMQKLGMSEDAIKTNLEQMGEEGQITWQQFNKMNDLVTNAFKPGAGLKSTKEAFQELIDSGNRGMNAIKALKDEAAKAKDEGISTFDQWSKKLLSEGFDSKTVNAFIDTLKKNGIKSFADILNADPAKLGPILGQMQDAGVAFKQVADNAQSTTDAINNLPSSKDITINFSSTMDDQTKAGLTAAGYFGSGGGSGSDNSPTPPQTRAADLMPHARLANLSSRALTGVRAAAAPVIHIDARGAAPGVENDIHRAMRAYIPHIVNHAVAAVQSNRVRGGSLRRAFSE